MVTVIKMLCSWYRKHGGAFNQKGYSDIHRYDEGELTKEFGLTPEQLIDMKGLMGDTSDNIPGVPGIGPKTSIKLLKEYGTLENVLANTENMNGNKIRENLTIYRQHALLSKDLATIHRDIPIDCSILSQPLNITKTPELRKLLLDLELSTIIERLEMEATNPEAIDRDKVV